MQGVVIQQPGAVGYQQKVVIADSNWNSGVFSCFSDFGSCIFGFLCPCIHMLTVTSRTNENCCTAIFAPIAVRTNYRVKNHIQGDVCDDCLCMMFCSSCAFCQIDRELKARNQ